MAAVEEEEAAEEESAMTAGVAVVEATATGTPDGSSADDGVTAVVSTLRSEQWPPRPPCLKPRMQRGFRSHCSEPERGSADARFPLGVEGLAMCFPPRPAGRRMSGVNSPPNAHSRRHRSRRAIACFSRIRSLRTSPADVACGLICALRASEPASCARDRFPPCDTDTTQRTPKRDGSAVNDVLYV